MEDLSLSHNRFTGSIPVAVLNASKLDLSSNQLSGRLADDYSPPSHSAELNLELNLELNRLSGALPQAELEGMRNGSVSILRGNMFSCGSVPGNDDFEEDYVCGSRNLNEALIVMSCVVGVFGFVLAVSCAALSLSANQSPSSGPAKV